VLGIQVGGVLPTAPIMGAFPIQPGGVISLGASYGDVRVVGMTIEEAQRAVREQLRSLVKDPVVSVSLIEIGARQQIAASTWSARTEPSPWEATAACWSWA